MTVRDKTQWSRSKLLNMTELAHVRETLQLGAEARMERFGEPYDLWKPIRETPLDVFFAKSDGSMEDMKINPHLPEVWFHHYNIRMGEIAKTNPQIGGKPLRETIAVPGTLSTLKIVDEIIEGAEPWSDWKQYSRIVEMDTPKVNVPKTQYTDTVGGDKASTAFSIDIYKEAGAKSGTVQIGGKMETIELDCSTTKNSFRGTIAVNRNDVKDNNFLAVEQPLKNAGNLYYYLAGKRLIDRLVADTTTNTATKAVLDLATPVHAEFEALSNVIRSKFPGTQRNRADTMFIHPADAFAAVATSTGASGTYPFLSRFLLGPTDNKDVVNNSGLAASLGLKNVWETPQIAENTVMITKRDVAQVVGLREDLTLENFDLTVGGLYQTDLLIRFDVKEAFEDGAFKITAF